MRHTDRAIRPSFDLEAFRASLGSVDVVAFDVFGVLLSPAFAQAHDLHRRVEAELVAKDARFAGYAEARRQAEKALRHRHSKSGFQDFPLAAVHEELGRALARDGLHQADEALALERSLARRLHVAHPIGRRLFAIASAASRPIVLFAETELPREDVEALLARAGFVGGTLFVSSELRLGTKSGDLQRFALGKLGVPPERALHVGVDPVAVAERASRVGLQGLAIGTPEAAIEERFPFVGSRLLETRRLFESASAALLSRAVRAGELDDLREDERYWYLLGHRLAGPAALALARFVRDEAIRVGAEKVLFFARDGQIVKRAYDALARDEEAAPPSAYVFASRRMLSVPFGVVSGPALATYYECYLRTSPTCDDFFASLPGSDGFRRRALEAGIPLDLSLSTNRANRDRLGRFVAENADVVFDALAPEREIVRDYLRSVVGAAKNVVVFDVGWRGSLQRGFEAALEGEGIEVHGTYLGTSEGTKVAGPPSRVRGYLLDHGKPRLHAEIVERSLIFFELLLYGDHPSLETVRRGADGAFEPVYLGGAQEEERLARARVVHRAVGDFLRAWGETFRSDDLPYVLDDDDVRFVLLTQAGEPRRVDAERFVGLSFSAALGHDEGVWVIHPEITDRRRYAAVERTSHWRQGAHVFRPVKGPLDRARDAYGDGRSLGRALRAIFGGTKGGS